MPIIFKGSGNKKPKLYEGNFSRSTREHTYTPRAGYDGWNRVWVSGYDYYVTGGNAYSYDVRNGKTFYSRGYQSTGNIQDVTLPNPSVEHSFSADKTQITFTVSYTPPSTGYNSSATAKTNTTYIDMPETTIQGAVFRNGTISTATVFAAGVYFGSFNIPYVSGKTLKHVSFVPATNTYTEQGNYIIQNMVVYDYLNTEYSDTNSVFVLKMDMTQSGDVSYDMFERLDISTTDYFTIERSGNYYNIRAKLSRYSVYNQYRYIAVYE